MATDSETGAQIGSDAPDGRATGGELAGESGNRRSYFDAFCDGGSLLDAQSVFPAESFTIGLCARQPRVRPLNDQVAFELCNCGDDGHCHLARRAAEIHPAKREAMHADPDHIKVLHGLLYVDGIPSEPVQLRYKQHIVRFESVKQLGKPLPLGRGDAPANALLNDALAIDIKTRSRDLGDLIHCGLFDGADAGIQKRSAHGVLGWVFVIGARILLHAQNVSRVIYEQVLRACTQTSGFVRGRDAE